MTFEDLKEEFNTKVKAEKPCSSEYRRFLETKDEATLLKVVYDNINWCLDHKVLSNEWLNKFNPETLLNSGLANTGLENTGIANSGDRNSGDRNSGDSNSGDRNSGDSNSGDSNSGDRNSGYRNSGNWNSGNWNSGNWNSGDSNSGDRNSGDRNSGDRNSGDRNSGNWNSGDRNSGDSNSGYRNSGAFCTEKNPMMVLFNKPTNMTVNEWENSKPCQIMYNIDTTLWIPFYKMTDEEKANNPKAETTDGYLKTIPMKDAWKNAWGNWSDESKDLFKGLPNFDASIFEEITGIKI